MEWNISRDILRKKVYYIFILNKMTRLKVGHFTKNSLSGMKHLRGSSQYYRRFHIKIYLYVYLIWIIISIQTSWYDVCVLQKVRVKNQHFYMCVGSLSNVSTYSAGQLYTLACWRRQGPYVKKRRHSFVKKQQCTASTSGLPKQPIMFEVSLEQGIWDIYHHMWKPHTHNEHLHSLALYSLRPDE